MAAVPPLAELDPERCYISWEMVLATTAEEDAIRDVFIFVEDNCELRIEPVPAPASYVKQRSAESGNEPEFESEADRTAMALREKRAQQGGRRIYDAPTTPRACGCRLPSWISL
jgi:chemotaxis protein histidine kinase CheA